MKLSKAGFMQITKRPNDILQHSHCPFRRRGAGASIPAIISKKPTRRPPSMQYFRLSCLAALASISLPLSAAPVADNGHPAPRRIVVDVAQALKPLDRYYDLSVGSDYPGTLQRDDSMAQLKTAVDELGFRYLRFHAIFHDVLKTVRREAGQLVFDFSGIDALYDALLARRIRPLVELGFTPLALATSPLKIFYWEGNTSHPE